MAEFQIIYGSKTEPKEEWSVYTHFEGVKAIEKWDNPQSANEIIKNLNADCKRFGLTNTAYMMRRLPDPVDYLLRETSRAGYQPFEVQGQEFHCAELTSEGLVTYYATVYDAYDDKRSKVRLGRYLRKHTDKTDNEISEICARHGFESGDSVVKFAKTREEIRKVYENGPRSCMSGRADAFETNGAHPAEFYAGGDTEVAYVERDERITARTVVIPSKKLYVGIYGDEGRLQPMLEELGYRAMHDVDRTAMQGLKFAKIDTGWGYAVPYFDFEGGVDQHEDSKFLTVKSGGSCGGGEVGWVDYYFDQGYNEEDPDYYDDGY